VLTLQEGTTPKAQVEGAGVDAKVTLGRRTIRFAGGKLALETSAPASPPAGP